MRRLWIAALMIMGLVLLPGATVVPTPHLPGNAVLIFNRGAVCTPGGGPNLYVQGFDLDGDQETAEVIMYGPIRPGGTSGDPVVWMFYDPTTGDLAYVVLTLPKQPATRMSLDELRVLYPSPCDLVAPGLRGV